MSVGKTGPAWWSPALFEGVPPVTASTKAPTMFRVLRDRLRCASADHMLVADPIKTPRPPNCKRLVLISDTHNAHRAVQSKLPPGDILVHAGDFTDVGSAHDVQQFAAWAREMGARYEAVVVIAGNHDLSLEKATYAHNYKRFGHGRMADSDALIAELRQSCVYLEHEAATVGGLRFFGSPYQPEFCDWAFNMGRETECRQRWASMIPEHDARPIDVLVTHGPPLGHGDSCVGSGPQGCWDLLDFVESRPPLLHVFGHIHEGYGATTNGRTVFANASSMNYHYDVRALHPPMVIDVPVPPAPVSKQEDGAADATAKPEATRASRADVEAAWRAHIADVNAVSPIE